MCFFIYIVAIGTVYNDMKNLSKILMFLRLSPFQPLNFFFRSVLT